MKIFSIKLDNLSLDSSKPFDYLEFEPVEVLKIVQAQLNKENLELMQSGVQFILRDGALHAWGQAYSIDADTPKVQIIA